MAEAVVNRLGKGRFRAISAGVEPAEEADPLAVDAMQAVGYGTDELRPKHWRQFTEPDAPMLDFVFTLSDSGTREAFPEWPGKPASSHWRYPDLTQAKGNEWEKQREYIQTLSALERQMRLFMQLSFPALDRMALKKRLDEIGEERNASRASS
jgi:protein-tyrosine-phosphatase